jgi:hypothetical protein
MVLVMAKNTMLVLNRTARNIPNYANKIVSDYEKASEEWGRILSDPKSKTVDGLAELINKNTDTFLEINTTGTWEDAMVWSALMYHYDAQTGLQFESRMHVQLIIDAIHKSDCSSYVKRTVDYAYYVLRDKKIEK